MDPRQSQQHPFSRNTASPYGRNSFPPAANQPPFPPSSHPPNATPSYTEHQRRPSEPPYYTPQQRSYPPDGPPMGGPGHARHQSASSISSRGMPPPSSPQQTQHHSYGAPPPPRGPPVSVGPPSAFPSGRDLSSLPPINAQAQSASSMRPQSTGMSISSMLGGPPPATREPPTTQYGSPIVTSTGGPAFPGTTHASPRMSTASEYAPFRRPQTPEHRSYESRDNRANSAGSPPGVGSYPTPEARRFGTPSRPGMPPAEERREPIRVPNPNAIPPRPSSQPNTYGGPQHAPSRRPVANPPYQESVFGRRQIDERQFQEGRPVERERVPEDRQMEQEIQRQRQMESEARHRELGRPIERGRDLESRRREREEINLWSKQAEGRERELLEQRFGRPPFEERQTSYGYVEGDFQRELREREQQRKRELAMIREQELRERELQERERERERAMAEQNSIHREYAHQQRNPQDPYNRPPEPREQAAWMRPGTEPSRPAYEPPERPPPQAQSSNGYEYPATTAPQYRDHPAYAPNEPRYAPASQPPSIPPQHSAPTAFEAYLEREQRAAQLHQAQQQQQQGTFQPALNGPYQSQESPRRRDLEDPQQLQQQQRLLGVQEINRRGRVSPLPQAVQGAQGQIGTPGGEPGIKSEFGRMFSGIGSGVGAMGAPSPVSAGQPLPFSNQLRREDVESLPGQDSPMENGKMARSSSRGGGNPRRRKLKEEDSRGDDESSTGRRTPSGRGKRAKTHHHAPHHHHHHHHAQRPEPQDNTSSPSLAQTPFKSTAGKPIPSPPNATTALHHHHIPASHLHHHNSNSNPNPKPPPSPKPTIPLPVRHISSTAVLQSVSALPRSHLGYAYYTSTLSPSSRPIRNGDPSRGFASTPKPLPRFEGRENCTFTVKIPRVVLGEGSRRDITYRRALWGTDVYTDDSDVLAAAIHSGWVQGAFAEDVGELGLSILLGDTCTLPPLDTEITEKPETGPSIVSEGKELHVTLLILPTLERYASSIRYGIKSREWGGEKRGGHDGLSFMILSVKWVSGSGISSIPSKQPFSNQLSQAELEEEENFARLFNGGPVGGDSRIAEAGFSNVRAEGRGSGNGFKGNWWKKGKGKGKGVGNGDGKERSVEVLAEAAAGLPAMEIIAGPSSGRAGVVERVVERMVENVHTGNGAVGDGGAGVRESVEVKREGEDVVA